MRPRRSVKVLAYPSHTSYPLTCPQLAQTPSSVSIRFPGFPVGRQPPQLLEPTPQLAPLLRGQLPSSRIVRVLRTSALDEACLHDYYSNGAFGVPRSGTRSVGEGQLRELLPVPRRARPLLCRIQYRTAHSRPPAAVACSPKPPVEREHHESPPGRQSQPRGVRAHGAPLGIGNRHGGRDWVEC